MMKRYLKIFLLAWCAVSSCLMNAENFVVKKKKKEPSVATLRTDCCDMSGDIVEALSGLQEQIAKLQKILIRKTRETLEDSSSSFFAHCDKEQLQNYLDAMKECQKSIVLLDKQLQQQQKVLTKSS